VREFIALTGVIACIIFGAIGTVFLLVSGVWWTIPLCPVWAAGALTLASKLTDWGWYAKAKR
jgi:hypothetical protein